MRIAKWGNSLPVRLPVAVTEARRKVRMNSEEVMAATAAIRALCETPIALTAAIHDEAVRISQRHKYHMQDGQVIESVRLAIHSGDCESQACVPTG